MLLLNTESTQIRVVTCGLAWSDDKLDNTDNFLLIINYQFVFNKYISILR